MDEAKKEKHKMDQRAWREGKEHVALQQEDARIMREIAAELGCFISRGIGAGKTGNISAIAALLVQAYQRNPAAVLELLDEPPSA
jgi:lysophospholipid acyltransferase (LPLAT)-like uncharacterized protein